MPPPPKNDGSILHLNGYQQKKNQYSKNVKCVHKKQVPDNSFLKVAFQALDSNTTHTGIRGHHWSTLQSFSTLNSYSITLKYILQPACYKRCKKNSPGTPRCFGTEANRAAGIRLCCTVTG